MSKKTKSEKKPQTTVRSESYVERWWREKREREAASGSDGAIQKYEGEKNQRGIPVEKGIPGADDVQEM